MQIQPHEPSENREMDAAHTGLAKDSVSLLGSVVLGISCVAPAYTLTATIGLVAAEAGLQMPVIFIAGFVPMFLAAYAYRELNRVSPDCGTSFTWTTKAFGPYVGWLGGWAALLATVIVLSNLAGVAVAFFYQFIGDVVGSETISGLWQNKVFAVITCLIFIAVAAAVACRGITTTERVQFVLVGFQMAMLVIFAVAAIVRSGLAQTGLAFDISWFGVGGLTLSAFIAGLSGSIFAFWGWDSCLTVNEESKDADKVPGRAALLTVTSILATYLLLAVATQMYAGVGDTGLGLNKPETSENVLGSLAAPVLGQPLNLLLFLAVLASSAASLMTTFLPTTRTMLAMGRYGALPARFATIHPKYQTPSYATVVAAVVAGLFYSVLTVVSENVLLDTIYSLGIMICFYYALTAFACIWYFKGELFRSRDSFVFKFLAPLLGGTVLVGVLLVTLRDSASPDYGSGASIGGVGLVLILGLGLILVGVFLMLYLSRRHPAFFRGETLHRDTPAFVAD